MTSALSFSVSVSADDNSANTSDVAVVFGKSISPADIGLTNSASVSRASKRLLDLIWREVGDRYAQTNNLVVTDQECEAFEKFNDLSEERRSKKRKQQLVDLERQLKSENLSEEKRTQLEKQRKGLLLLESQRDEMLKYPTYQEMRRKASRKWLTWKKVDKAVYEQYGGKVAKTAFGPYPIEAKRNLIKEHMRAGDIRFLDAEFEKEFWKSYEQGGRLTAEKDQIDFTPYWLKPIPDDTD